MADDVHSQVRIVVQPYGSGLPLGFFSFGIGMFLLAAGGAGWVAVAQAKPIGLLLAAFVFPLELLAAIVAFLARDTVAGTSLGLFASSWLAIGLLGYTSPPGTLSAGLGYYLIAFTVVVLLLAVAAVFGKPMVAALLVLAAARAVAAAVFELGGGQGWERAGGWLALAIFVVAMYGGLAFLLEETLGRTVLPLFRTGDSRGAIEGDLSEQLRGLAQEAGVRQTL